jgi:hypothetical protein
MMARVMGLFLDSLRKIPNECPRSIGPRCAPNTGLACFPFDGPSGKGAPHESLLALPLLAQSEVQVQVFKGVQLPPR